MTFFQDMGAMLGCMAFWMQIAAFKRIGELEAELKRRHLIDGDFGDIPKEEPISDPRTWSAAKKARVEAARRKVMVARLKLMPFFAVPVVLIVLELLGMLR